MKRLIGLVAVFIITICSINGQSVVQNLKPAPHLLNKPWAARWVSPPDVGPKDYGVYMFRRNFDLPAKPETFVLNISADNRYRLFVNGQPVCWGPASGDLNCWYYETVDIASFLSAGKNTLAVEVWNWGEYYPQRQISWETGLIVQGNTDAEAIVNTPDDWLVAQNVAFAPIWIDYLGANDTINGKQYPWGWEQLDYDDTDWKPVAVKVAGFPFGAHPSGRQTRALAPREIPLMEETQLRIPVLRRAEGLTKIAPFYNGKEPFTVPSRSFCRLLLDQTYLTTAYPELIVSRGKGATIKINYSEAMFDANEQKANRNDIEDRSVDPYKGSYDVFLPDGASRRLFRPLWFRTYRYVQIEIQTGDEPLTIEDFYGQYTGYPFEERGNFVSDDATLDDIWTVGWRTARLCAHETYFDCPYYEQMQYTGDTRIQALISLYVSGDDRLMRQAIRIYDRSRSFEGLTQSRYPTSNPQYILGFSLYWVNMVHDYWMHRDDRQFVAEFIPGVKAAMEWFLNRIDPETGMLYGELPHWKFVDWARNWHYGEPPQSPEYGSSVLSLMLADALREAAELMEAFRQPSEAEIYRTAAESLKRNVYEKSWDDGRGLLRDFPGANTYSQHVNIMGILTEAIPVADQMAVYRKITEDPTVTAATFYYRFYLTRACKKVGLADEYLSMLGPWKDMLAKGLTTFAEKPEPTRSDCHAWSSSPNYDLLATVAGVEPDSPGFRTVKIEPHPGHLASFDAVVPHPAGDIRVEYQRLEAPTADGARHKFTVALPENLPGRFVWQGQRFEIDGSGERVFRLP